VTRSHPSPLVLPREPDKVAQAANPVPLILASLEVEKIAEDIPPDKLGNRGGTWTPTVERLRTSDLSVERRTPGKGFKITTFYNKSQDRAYHMRSSPCVPILDSGSPSAQLVI